MQYILLIYSSEAEAAKMSEAEGGKMFADYMTFTKSVRESGQYVAGDPLERSKTAKSVRVREGKTAITDGPFAETKEQLGGYYIVEAKSIEEACEIGSRIPGARVGTIEVRPLMKLPNM